MSEKETMGARIRRLRLGMKLTQREIVAKMIEAGADADLQANTFSRWEADRSSPREINLTALAQVVQRSPAYIEYGGSDAPPEAHVELDDQYEARPGDLAEAIRLYPLQPESERALRGQRWSGGPPTLEDLLTRARTLRGQEAGKVPDLGLEAKGKASAGERGL